MLKKYTQPGIQMPHCTNCIPYVLFTSELRCVLLSRSEMHV